MFYVYLLESKKDKSWYIGYSSNLKKRFESHNKGENTATKSKKPWNIIYYEAYVEMSDAKNRELFLKSGSGRRFLKKQIRKYLEK
ncbi:MAG: GIY-YIG nuclease family protein [Candidatus Moranbacteria bacterium]|nr:GIY-YIG nuclease family protein [Candidatus Moranbacteria bacterium]